MAIGSFIKYVRKISRKTNISNPLIRTCTCGYHGVRNVSFSGNFAYVLNGRPLGAYVLFPGFKILLVFFHRMFFSILVVYQRVILYQVLECVLNT